MRQVKEDGTSLAEVKKGISLSMPKMPHAEDAATGAYAKLDPPFFHNASSVLSSTVYSPQTDVMYVLLQSMGSELVIIGV